MLGDAEILEIVSTRGPDLKRACRDLVAAANDRGGRDNISAVLLRYTP
jgi:serine/threonine protein phosphatase PrpC